VTASIRAGIFVCDCNGCDENSRKEWGCYDAVEHPVWEDEDDAFYNCPARFIAPCVADFLDRYTAIKNGWARPLNYDEYQNRFLAYVNCFEAELKKAMNIKNKGAKNAE
jgi:hypothetical protein